MNAWMANGYEGFLGETSGGGNRWGRKFVLCGGKAKDSLHGQAARSWIDTYIYIYNACTHSTVFLHSIQPISTFLNIKELLPPWRRSLAPTPQIPPPSSLAGTFFNIGHRLNPPVRQRLATIMHQKTGTKPPKKSASWTSMRGYDQFNLQTPFPGAAPQGPTPT